MADLGGSTYSLRIKAVLDTSQMRQELNRLNGNQSVAGGPGHFRNRMIYRRPSRAEVLREKGINPADVATGAWAPGSREGQLQRYTNLYRNQVGMKGIYFNSDGRTMKIKKGYGSIVKNELAAMRAERAASTAESSAVSKAARGGSRSIGRLNRGALGIAAVLAADAFASSDYGNKGPLSAKSYFGNIASGAAQGGMVGGMVGGPWGAAIGSIGGGLYSIFNQNKEYEESKKQTEEQADELVSYWNEALTDSLRKRLKNAKGGKALINEMETLRKQRELGETPSEELVSEAAKDLKTVAGKFRKVSPGEFRLHEMQKLGFRPLEFKALSNLGSLGIFTGANEKNAAELVGKTAQMVDYLKQIEHNTEQWSVTYA